MSKQKESFATSTNDATCSTVSNTEDCFANLGEQPEQTSDQLRLIEIDVASNRTRNEQNSSKDMKMSMEEDSLVSKDSAREGADLGHYPSLAFILLRLYGARLLPWLLLKALRDFLNLLHPFYLKYVHIGDELFWQLVWQTVIYTNH